MFSRFEKDCGVLVRWDAGDKLMKYTLCGYCEYGYRLFIAECGKVYRFPIPLTEIY